MSEDEVKYRSTLMNDAVEYFVEAGLEHEDAVIAVKAIASGQIANVMFDFARE
jgi:hypothetical protein